MITTNPIAAEWQTQNQQRLMSALDRVRQRLQGDRSTAAESIASDTSALSQLCRLFNLSAFERDLLVLCAGMELDAAFGTLCAQAQPEVKHGAPTFSLAAAIFEHCHWEAFTPNAALRRWQLIEVGTGSTLMTSLLRIDEQILHFLMGIPQLDDRLFGLIKPVEASGFLVESHQALVQEFVAAWWQLLEGVEQPPSSPSPFSLGEKGNRTFKVPLPQGEGFRVRARSLPLIQLCGSEAASKRSIAAAACRQLNLNLYTVSSNAIPTSNADLQPLIRLWEREAILSQSALLLDWDETHENDTARDCAIALLVESANSPLIVTSRDRRSFPQRPVVTLDVNNPTSSEQLELWNHALGTNPNGLIERLVSQFNLSSTAIEAASLQALGNQQEGESSDRLWNICRLQARPQLDDLAQRIDPGETWDDLVLPDQQKQILREAAAHVRQRSKVYEQWGFAKKGGRGLGISALFSGISGTGKTMAAGVLAQELKLDLYRIDLSSVVSKYIGETEKNLRRVFDAAEAGGVVLLFDEADSLFGKRSEVKDSHDRYANMEVSYLLQRMEAYRGLAILTTNLKEAIDPAFMRRIRFVVRFAFPEFGDRARIWERIFPAHTPTEGLNYKKLAKLNIAGGNIRNIAMNAAFIAADENQPVQMVHLLKAAQGEYLKLERSMTEAEVRGWVNDP